MRTVTTHGTFKQTISKADPELQAIARSLRDLIEEVYPEVVEVPWPRQQIAGYGVGPKKMSEHFCHIAVQPEYVNLGFNFGAELPDPENLLEGTGKVFRHVKILSEGDVKRPALKRLIEAAVEKRQNALSTKK